MKQNRVVVTGMGVISSNAHGLGDLEDALRNSKSGIRYIEELEEYGFGCRVGGRPQDVASKLENYFTEEDMIAMNEAMIYAGISGIDAWKDAGFEVSRENTDEVFWDTGAVIGCGLGGMDTIIDKLVPGVANKKIRRMGSTIAEQVMSSSVSAKLGGILGLGGQVTSNSSACTTGTEAIIEGYYKIKYGHSDKMLVGSVEGSDKHIWAGFDSMRVLNTKLNAEPQKASRPMSQTAGGFIPGSGGGILFLESLESASKRNARIYAEIAGASVNSGGHRQGGSMTAPNPNGVKLCIKNAVKSAQIEGSQVDSINGHLTATFADPLEIENWRGALNVKPEEMPYVNATKSLIGHGLGAAGSIEMVCAVIQIYKGFLHGSLNCEDLHEKLLPFKDRIVQKTVDMDINILAKASFGFGDVNGCIVLKKWPS